MNNWQDVWARLESGQHVVVRRTGPIPQSDPTRLRLSRVDCEVFPEPRGTLEEARRRIDAALGVNPVVDAASRHLRAGLRRHLLGEDPDEVDVARYEDALARSFTLAGHGSRHALLLCGMDRADPASIELLTRLFAGERRPKWPLLISFDASEPTGIARQLLLQLERVLPPEAFWRDARVEPIAAALSPFELLQTLSPASLRVLRAGATVGERFDAETLAELLDLDELAVLDALQEATDVGLSIEDRGNGAFRFGPGLKVVLRDGTLPSLARMWHQRLSAHFGGSPAVVRVQASGPPSRVSATASGNIEQELVAAAPLGPRTLEALAPPATPSPEVQPSIVDARRSEAVGIPRTERDGSVYLAASPTAHTGLRDPREAEWWRRLEAEATKLRGAAGAAEGRESDAPPTWRSELLAAARGNDEQRAAAHAEAAGLWGAACEQHLAVAERASFEGPAEHALEHAARALALADEIEGAERQRQVRTRGLLIIGRSRWQFRSPGSESLELALASLTEARGFLRDTDPAELRAEVSTSIANVCYDIGTSLALERALVELTLAGQVLLEARRPLDAARLLNDEAAVWVKLGDPVRANLLLTRSRDIFGKVADSYPAARLELLETEHLLARLMLHATPRPGREREAVQLGIEHALVAQEGYRELGDQRKLARVWETIGRLLLGLGRLDEATEKLEDAERMQRKIGDAIGLARSSGALSEVCAAAHDYPRALQRLVESVAFNSEKGSGAGLHFNLASLKELEPHLPEALRDDARLLERRLELALHAG